MASGRRESRSSKPVPSQVRKPIQIKPLEQNAATSSTICGVCRRPDCKLQSHKAYLANRRQTTAAKTVETPNRSESASPPNQLGPVYTQSYAYTKALPSLGAGKLDGFNDLPIPEGHKIDLHESVYNREFHSTRCSESRSIM
jgi:hypothetical protein